MAGPIVTLGFAGDASALDKTFADVGSSADKMAKDVGAASKKMGDAGADGFDKLRDGADNGERRIIGFKDALTGTKDLTQGFATGNLEMMAQGFADLASSVANLGADMLKWGKRALEGGAQAVKAHAMSAASTAKDTAAMVAHKAASIASTVATKTMAAAQWILNAAMSANPIMLVVLGLGALVAAFVLAWQHSETFREIVTGAFDTVKRIAESAWSWIKDNWPLLLGILTGPIGLAVLAITKNWDTIKDGFSSVKTWIGDRVDDIVGFFTGLPGRIKDATKTVAGILFAPYKLAFEGIAKLWNGTAGKLSFKAPDWVPGLGGKGWSMPNMPETISIPGLADGGIALARPGGTLARIAEGGRDEAVIPLPTGWRSGAGVGGSSVTVVIHGHVYSDIDFDRKLQDGIARARSNGARI